MKMLKQMVNWFMVRYTVARINLKDGDILLFKDKRGGYREPDNWRLLGGLREFLDKNNLKNVLMLYLNKDCELQNVSEEEMDQAGWFRGNQQLLEAYRTKRKYDGLNGRPWDATKHLKAERHIELLEDGSNKI